jgi:hypothetical protein
MQLLAKADVPGPDARVTRRLRPYAGQAEIWDQGMNTAAGLIVQEGGDPTSNGVKVGRIAAGFLATYGARG